LPSTQGAVASLLEILQNDADVSMSRLPGFASVLMLPLHGRLFAGMPDEESDEEEYESGRCLTYVDVRILPDFVCSFLQSLSIAPSSSSAFF
jgi:hypothetical protein